MPLTLTKVHEYARHTDPVTGEIRQQLVGYHPYLALKYGQEGPIYLQDGAMWWANGAPVADPPPPWVADAIAQCTPKALQAVGFGKQQPSPVMPPELIDCTPEELAELLRLVQARRQAETGGVEPAVFLPTSAPDAPDPAEPPPFEAEDATSTLVDIFLSSSAAPVRSKR